jgi:protein phosphatase-4 regulatory subunit 3
LAYVETFRELISMHEQSNALMPNAPSFTTVSTDMTSRNTVPTNGQRWQGLCEADAAEEAYFNSDDHEEDEVLTPPKNKLLSNGTSSSKSVKPLVDYPDDDEGETEEETSIANKTKGIEANGSATSEEDELAGPPRRERTPPPPERLSEKRRREEDEDDDELVKLVQQPKRRSSVGSTSSNASVSNITTKSLRRKQSINSGKDGGPGSKKIQISLTVKSEKAKVEGEPS